MCVALIRSPPTATAMSCRSVELVTTFSCAIAGALVKSAAMAMRCLVFMRLLLPVRWPASERMRLVRTDRERRLQQDPVQGGAARGQIVLHALERRVDLRELAREPLEIPR